LGSPLCEVLFFQHITFSSVYSLHANFDYIMGFCILFRQHYECFLRQDMQPCSSNHLLALLMVLLVSVLIQIEWLIKVLEMWIDIQKLITLWSRYRKNPLPPNGEMAFLLGLLHSWVPVL
jgi:hypothetical protein